MTEDLVVVELERILLKTAGWNYLASQNVYHSWGHKAFLRACPLQINAIALDGLPSRNKNVFFLYL